MNVIIRESTIDDCKSVAKVVTLGWNQTYKGIVNESFLNLLKENEAARVNRLTKEYNQEENNTIVLEVENEVVGFITYGKSEIENYQNIGEIRAFYIIEGYKGLGYGKEMFIAATKEIIKSGFDKMIIGCLEGNPSNNFYSHMGGEKVGTQTIVRGNQELLENLYYYDNLHKLLENINK